MRKLLYLLRLVPILPGVCWKNKAFRMDLARWKQVCHIHDSDTMALARLLWCYQEFRNLYLYRNTGRRLYCLWVKLWYKPMDTLYIHCPKIGGGLFIQHGFATMIAAKSIGENCWINQQVSIGYNGKGTPTIGDNVMITCGAKVLGDFHVGNNAIIGANAVVVRDVEPGAVMGGVPARKIK